MYLASVNRDNLDGAASSLANLLSMRPPQRSAKRMTIGSHATLFLFDPENAVSGPGYDTD